MLKRITKYNEIEMWISILEGFAVNKVLEISLKFLKLKEKGLTLCEIMKALNEIYQT